MPYSLRLVLSRLKWWPLCGGSTRAEATSAGLSALRRTAAFSMIELLVGFAVLAVLVTLLASAFSNFSQVTSSSSRRIEVNKQPRTMFDRMAFDIGSAVDSGGVRMVFRKNETLPDRAGSINDALILLSEAKSRDPQGRMANVGYSVGSYTDQSRTDKTGQPLVIQTVLRYVQAYRWDDDTTQIDISMSKPDASPIDSQPIAPGVLRFELSFLMDDGKMLAEPPPEGPALDDFYEDLTAIICTVATLDEDTLQKMSSTERNSLAAQLKDAELEKNPLAEWQATDLSGFPKPVAQGVRFHQRFFRVK